MELKDLKDVSKPVDRKLKKAAAKEKQLQEQEQRELEQQDQEEMQTFTHVNADENEKTNTSVTQKVLFCVGAVALVVGVVQLQKVRSVHE